MHCGHHWPEVRAASQPFATVKRAVSGVLPAPPAKRAAGSPVHRAHTPQPVAAPVAAAAAAAAVAAGSVLVSLQSDSAPVCGQAAPAAPEAVVQLREGDQAAAAGPPRGVRRVGSGAGAMDEATRRTLCEVGYCSPSGPLLRPSSRSGAGAGATPHAWRLAALRGAAASGRAAPALPHMPTPGALHAPRHSFASPPFVFTTHGHHPAILPPLRGIAREGDELPPMMLTPQPPSDAAAGHASDRSAWTPRLGHRRDGAASASQQAPCGGAAAPGAAPQQGAGHSRPPGSGAEAATHVQLPGMTVEQHRDRKHLIGAAPARHPIRSTATNC